MFCKNCGNKLSDGAKFCPFCGTMIAETPAPENLPEETSLPEEPVSPEVRPESAAQEEPFGASADDPEAATSE